MNPLTHISINAGVAAAARHTWPGKDRHDSPRPGPWAQPESRTDFPLTRSTEDGGGSRYLFVSVIQRRRWARRTIALFVLAVSLASLFSYCVREAAAQSTPPSVEAGRQALARAARFPWYDRQQDAVRPITVQPRKDLANRHSRWEAQQRQVSLPPWMGTLLKYTLWTVLGLLFAVVIYLLIKMFLTLEVDRPGRPARAAAQTPGGDVDRIESLPFELQTSQTDLLAEAKRLYEAGQFGPALVYLYSYQLIQLDKHHLIRLARGKTNRQYLREVRRRPDVRGLLERTMIAFEDFFFGHYSIDRQRFESCWQALDEFHAQLSQTTT